jgi:hypothetical protein
MSKVTRTFGLLILSLVSCGGTKRPATDGGVDAHDAHDGPVDIASDDGNRDAGGASDGPDGGDTSGDGNRDAGDASDGPDAGDASGDADGDGATPITEDEFCGLVAQTECQAVVPRCVTITMPACLARRRSLCLEVGARAQSGPRRFRPENASACIDQIAAAYAKTTISPADQAAVDDACGWVYQGDAGLFDACTVKYDCNNASRICDKGFCSDRRVQTLGAVCGNPGDVCATGAYCGQMSTGVFSCLAKGSAGAACDATVPCLEALRCAATTCASRVGAAGSCTSNADCAAAAPFCDPYAGNRCDLGLSFAAGAPSCAPFGSDATDAAPPG